MAWRWEFQNFRAEALTGQSFSSPPDTEFLSFSLFQSLISLSPHYSLFWQQTLRITQQIFGFLNFFSIKGTTRTFTPVEVEKTNSQKPWEDTVVPTRKSWNGEEVPRFAVAASDSSVLGGNWDFFSLLQHFVLCNQHLFISFTLWRQQKGLKVSQNKPRLERTHGIWAWLMWAKGTTLNGSTRRGNDIEVTLEEQKFLKSREIGQAKNSWFFGTNSQLPQCWGLPLNLSQCTGLAWSPGNSWF